MLNETDVCRVARDMIDDYGSASARDQAVLRAQAMSVVGREAAYRVWLRVARFIDDLVECPKRPRLGPRNVVG